MMAFTERGFIWVKTILGKRAKEEQMQASSQIKRPRDGGADDVKWEQVEKAFENVFLTKKEDWEIKIEKYLPTEGQQLQGFQDQSGKQVDKVKCLKVFQENGSQNAIIEISWNSKVPNQEVSKEVYSYIRTNREFISRLERISIKQSPLGVLTIKGNTYEFGDYIIRIGKLFNNNNHLKTKIQVEYTPSKFEIGTNQNADEYASVVINPVLNHIFQSFEEFKDVRGAMSDQKVDPVTQEPKRLILEKELSEIPHPFKSTHFFISAYFDDTFSNKGS